MSAVAKEAGVASKRAGRKRKQPPTATATTAAAEEATATPASNAQSGHVFIPLRNKRLRKHAALIQTATSGVLLCCSRKRESECMTSVLRLLQLYADEMYGVWVKGREGEEADGTTRADVEDEEDGGEEATVAVGQSIADRDDQAHAQLTKHRGRFSLVSAGGVEGLAFIACNDALVSTTQLTFRILASLQSNTLPAPLSPHLSRLLPVHTTASATSIDHILARFHHLTPHLLAARSVDAAQRSPVTFAVVFRSSNNRAIARDEAITALAARVESEATAAGVSVAVRLVGAELSVLCWLVKSVAMLAVLPDYHKHCEYSVDKLRPSAALSQPTAGATNGGIDTEADTEQPTASDAAPSAT